MPNKSAKAPERAAPSMVAALGGATNGPPPPPVPPRIITDGTRLRTAQLIDLCTSSISYDRQVQAGCQAFDRQMYEIIDDTGQVIMIPSIMGLTDSTLVDILAWQFHVDFYDHTKDLTFRKQLVQNAIVWHMTKGTVALVQWVLDTYFPGGATIQEWYEYMNPLPPNYPTVNADTQVATFAASQVDVAGDRFLIAATGLANNDQVRFVAGGFAVTGRLPSPLLPGLFYWVINAVDPIFQVSPSRGGSAVDILDQGAGNNNEIWKRGIGNWHDRYRFRILVDEAIIPPDKQAYALKLINAYKPVSRWLDGFVRQVVSECDIGWAGMVLRFIYRESEAPSYP
jgi:P2-related tail formation protein